MAPRQLLACALLDLECVIYMGRKDAERQQTNVFRMEPHGRNRDSCRRR